MICKNLHDKVGLEASFAALSKKIYHYLINVAWNPNAYLVVIEEEAPVLRALGTVEQLNDMASTLASVRRVVDEVFLDNIHGVRAETCAPVRTLLVELECEGIQ